MSSVTVRTAAGFDEKLVAELVALHKKAIPTHMQYDKSGQYFAEALRDERNLNIVMRGQDGTVIGHLLGIPQSRVFEELRRWDPDMQDDSERLYLDTIQILPEQRHRNLSIYLIRKLCEEAEKRNIFKLSMHARTTTGWSRYQFRIFSGVRFLRRIENWYGFGEPFDYLESTTTLKTTACRAPGRKPQGKRITSG